jgi:thioredoxin 1
MKKLFYFSADWCVPCQSFSPIMDKINSTIPVEKINIEYETDRTKAAGIMSVPTVVLAENGQEVRRFVGAKSYQEVMQFING